MWQVHEHPGRTNEEAVEEFWRDSVGFRANFLDAIEDDTDSTGGRTGETP